MRRVTDVFGRLWDAAGAAVFLALYGAGPAYAVTAVDVARTIFKFVLWSALGFIYTISFVGVAAGLKELVLSSGQYGEGRGAWKKLIWGALGIIIPTLIILFKIYVLKNEQASVVPGFLESGPESLSTIQ
ncbi:hypothetical protein [Thermosulfurimonas sp. F29]|uniref:hypothetical protein n=1 Tax=Thermosulfurimonas sp. F29 TaxID=2867247 RepID=UPI001C82D13E|nr:hypothetical protein [Thermosulfurimonas sp. F29]MBX6424220.1 hypothetical protein [Thermosulfurimonas sp. F29]